MSASVTLTIEVSASEFKFTVELLAESSPFFERLLRLPSVKDDPCAAGFKFGGFLIINVLTYIENQSY